MYKLDGTVYKTGLSLSVLSLCELSDDPAVLGRLIELNCDISIPSIQAFNDQTYLYEILYTPSSSSSSSYPLPVYKNGGSSSYSTRFTLVDTTAVVSSYVRVAGKLVIDLISSPSVSVDYVVVSASTESSLYVSFTSIYLEDTSRTGMIVSLVLLNILGLFYGLRAATCRSSLIFVENSGFFQSKLPHFLQSILNGLLICNAFFYMFYSIGVYFGKGYGTNFISTADGYVIFLLLLCLLGIYGDLNGLKNMFIYFMDWEPEENRSVSVWRSLFIANEFYERVNRGRTVSEYTWLGMLFFMVACGWDSENQFDSSSGYSPVAQYSFTMLLWSGIIIGSLVIRKSLQIFRGSDLLNFVDVCSLSNISVIILDSPGHGWYLHGRAPSGKGDWSALELASKLKEEAAGMFVPRGLLPDDPYRCTIQSFELFVPDAEFQTQLSVTETANTGELLIALIEKLVRHQAVRPPSMFQWTGIGFITDVALVEDRTGLKWAESLLYGTSFMGIPTGSEFRLIFTEFLLFAMIFRYSSSLLLAAFLAYLIGAGIRKLRLIQARLTIPISAGIDSRFLL
jgi:Meckelin (Transmembrane protein 67)